MVIDRLRDGKRLLLGNDIGAQLLRYVLAGGAVTVLQLLVYWCLASRLLIAPQLSNLLAYLAAVASGYVLHGRFSFRGHGQSDSPYVRAMKFVAVSLVSLGLNAFWIWLCVERFAWPLWAPMPLMGFVTPGLVFLLNRHWVFR